MAKQFQSIKGFYDIPPDRQKLFRHFEDIALNVFDSYAYEEIGLPIVEPTGLFIDSVGSFTDIVEKEMYSWVDQLNNDKLTLRPEGTAGCVRAVIQNSLTYNGPAKLFYRGPMFRHENVQKGRQRQFNQLGAESFGIENSIADAEQIIMLSRLWDNLGLKNIKLVINSIGDKDCRQKHRHELIEYFKKNSALLDEDSKRRLNDNPLRILDSKNPEMQDMLNGAPKIMEYLNEGALNHFNQLKRLLDENQVKYEVNSRLVRGLDYYNRTVFEWISNDLGSQGTIAGGGRYDYLIENLGGKPTFACGFAIGVERIVLLLEKSENPQSFYNSDIYIVCQGHDTQNYAINIAEKLRGSDYKVSMNLENSSFKSQFKKADKSNAKIAIIIGEDELKNNVIQIKLMRNQGSQESVGVNDLLQRVRDIFKN